jgi:hypothetical protein
MSKAEAGNRTMFFIRHLTLLNTSKNVKFRKSFSLLPWSAGPRRERAIRSTLALEVAL